MEFPTTRMRRLRKNPQIRKIVRETKLNKEDFIYPMFVNEDLNDGEIEEIKTMPGEKRYSISGIVDYAKTLEKKGLKSILLFGLPSNKDGHASSAYDPQGIIQKTVRQLKEETNLIVITDVCMCEYTSHGHCGILEGSVVKNDITLKYLSKIALSHAEAGADVVAPSDMMDGRVGSIRKTLDNNSYEDTIIMAYSAKYASAYYAPFRDAAGSAPSFGNRKSYQMDSGNIQEALREVELDIIEGADIVMVKPALSYLDVIKAVKDKFQMPTAAYNVSGEFSMLKAGIDAGFLTEDAIFETLLSIKRAGSDLIISHFAPYMLDII